MSYVNDVKSDIRNALYNYCGDISCGIRYTRGSDDGCGYFTVYINDDDYDENDAEAALESVADDYGFWIDDDSDGFLDLCEQFD